MSPDESWTWTATTFRMELLSHDKGWQGSKGQGGQNLSVLGLDRPLGTRLDLVSWGPNDIEMTKCPKTRRSSKHIPRFSKHIGFFDSLGSEPHKIYEGITRARVAKAPQFPPWRKPRQFHRPSRWRAFGPDMAPEAPEAPEDCAVQLLGSWGCFHHFSMAFRSFSIDQLFPEMLEDLTISLRWIFLVMGDNYHHSKQLRLTKNDTYSMINDIL